MFVRAEGVVYLPTLRKVREGWGTAFYSLHPIPYTLLLHPTPCPYALARLPAGRETCLPRFTRQSW